MSKDEVKVPLFINGKQLLSEDNNNVYRFEGDNVDFILPKLSLEELVAIEESHPADSKIARLPLNEILYFLSQVGKLWEDKEYPLRKKLLEYGPELTGESKAMYELTISLIVSLTYYQTFSQYMIESEIGDKRLLDEWIPRYDCYSRAVPLGKLMHVVAGNVPIAGVYSLIRGLFTKNINICKLPGREILTVSLFVQSFFDVDPNHPITKSTAVHYWGRDEEDKVDHYTTQGDGLCIWGGGDTVKYYKSKANIGTEIIEYGPKLGAQIIQWDENSEDDLHLRVARDICVFGQEACFSPQIIYLIGDADEFIEKLAEGLETYSNIWPKGRREIDHYAHMNYFKMVNQTKGNVATFSEKRDWLIVKIQKQSNVLVDQPLGRTVYVHQLDKVEDCFGYISKHNQTIGVEPKSLAHQIKDELVYRGVLRISNVGYVDGPRLGLSHDGVTLNRLIKMVGLERDYEYSHKVYDIEDSFEHFDLEFRKVTN
jgi:long-chain-fatty-acyl-CoA reductase